MGASKVGRREVCFTQEELINIAASLFGFALWVKTSLHRKFRRKRIRLNSFWRV